jgi:hypothetical protein
LGTADQRLELIKVLFSTFDQGGFVVESIGCFNFFGRRHLPK